MAARAVSPRSCGSIGTSRQKSTGMPISAHPSSKMRLATVPPSTSWGKKTMANAVVTLVGKQVAALLGLLAEEAMGHLEEDAGTIAGVLLESLPPTMLEVHEHRKGIVE